MRLSQFNTEGWKVYSLGCRSGCPWPASFSKAPPLAIIIIFIATLHPHLATSRSSPILLLSHRGSFYYLHSTEGIDKSAAEMI